MVHETIQGTFRQTNLTSESAEYLAKREELRLAEIELMRQREISTRCEPSRFEGTVALLCSEPTAEKCHRRLLAELFAEKFNREGHSVKILHLSLGKAQEKTRKPRGEKAAAHML